jgi:predicted transcriptional regulator
VTNIKDIGGLMDVLLSIKPKFAEAIIDGRKRYEFRKIKFANKDINRVCIYATSPVKKIIGVFKISNIIEDRPHALWDRLKDHAGISEEEFFNYFSNSEKGFALEIKDVEKFENPIDPNALIPNFVPPQSFYYIKDTINLLGDQIEFESLRARGRISGL